MADIVATFCAAKPGFQYRTHWQSLCGEASTFFFFCFVIGQLCGVCILPLDALQAQYWQLTSQVLSMSSTCCYLHHYVKAKDCSPYTHIIPCSRLCRVINEHDHGALVLDKANLSVLVYVVQSPKFLSSKGYSCKLSLSSNIGEAISPLTALYMQRWPIGLPVQVVPLSATQVKV